MVRPRPWSALALPFALALAATGCIDRSIAEIDPNASGARQTRFPVAIVPKLDLLFVVDDSGSMKREQDQMVANFNRMIEVLENLPVGLPDIHIGVVSTDVGANGCDAAPPAGVLRSAANPTHDPALDGCTAPTDAYISDEVDPSGNRTRNYDPGQGLARTFACIAKLGTDGCHYEQPLQAMQLALSPSTTANAGFRRSDAMLAVVFLTDEDDCSVAHQELFSHEQTVVVGGQTINIGPENKNFRCFGFAVECEHAPAPSADGREVEWTGCTPRDDAPFHRSVAEFTDFLTHLQPEEGQLVVAGIMGDAAPIKVSLDADGDQALGRSCEIGPDDEQGAFPPVRTDAFLNSFPNRVRTRICDADLSPAMKEIGDYIGKKIIDHCLTGAPVDRDPATEGIQPECTVAEIQNPHQANEEQRTLPLCDNASDPGASSHLPCYLLAENLDVCTKEDEPSHLEVQLHYPAGVEPPSGAVVAADCLTR